MSCMPISRFDEIAALTAAAAMLIEDSPGSVLSEMRWGASEGEEAIPDGFEFRTGSISHVHIEIPGVTFVDQWQCRVDFGC